MEIQIQDPDQTRISALFSAIMQITGTYTFHFHVWANTSTLLLRTSIWWKMLWNACINDMYPVPFGVSEPISCLFYSPKSHKSEGSAHLTSLLYLYTCNCAALLLPLMGLRANNYDLTWFFINHGSCRWSGSREMENKSEITNEWATHCTCPDMMGEG
jgi:hypothetical protein